MKHQIYLLVIAMSTVFTTMAQQKFFASYHLTDKDTTLLHEISNLQAEFENPVAFEQYVNTIPKTFKLRGFLTVSIDSVYMDAAGAEIWIYMGKRYNTMYIRTDSADQQMLNAINWPGDVFKQFSFSALQFWQEKMLQYYENNGRPFARITLDSVLVDGGIAAMLRTDPGPLYRIDSIRNYGGSNISVRFLEKYLGIGGGTLYKKSKLNDVSKRLLELPYVREIRAWDMTMVEEGAVLNLYVAPKKSSQADVIVGFLPSAPSETGRTKLQLTGEANIKLQNAFNKGETIGVNWQQIQVRSPRLNLQYIHPFIFNSSIGFDFNFNMLKKDSTFLNLSTQVGIQYVATGRQTGRVFFQNLFSNVLPEGLDTAAIRISRKLPALADVTTNNLGFSYLYNNTDYRFNPRKGHEALIVATAGIRTIKPNTAVAGIKSDEGNNDFDFTSLYDNIQKRSQMLKLNLSGAKYFRTSSQSVVKAGFNGGIMHAPAIFLNEMYQIGGYKLLRGFDEESIYANAYSVMTAEFRYFMGLNSYFFGFADGAWAENSGFNMTRVNHTYIGMGLGLAFETRAGIFNLTYAVGKRDDVPLNFRQAKIHFGLISLF